MLGKVVGGALAALGEYPPGTEDAAVADLVDRVADELAPVEGRVDAAERLRDLLEDSVKAQLALGASSALATLFAVLRRGNAATIRPVLECLAVALAQQPPQQGQPPSTAPLPGAINAELFSRMEGSLALVLGLLAPDAAMASDFGARYYAARLLTACAVANPGRAVAALLGAPAGVGRVMDLVADPHDAVRNEALILALTLARTSPDVQQVAVLEGGFERLLNLVAAEGGTDGGAVVQDCLDLVAALVARHAGNGVQFQEAGHLGRLVPLLRQVDPVKKPSPQQAANIGAVLDVVVALVDRDATPVVALPGQPVGPRGDAAALASAARANQDALVSAGLVPTLVALCLDNGGMPEEGVRVRAMTALAALVRACPPGQAALGGATISVVGRTLPVVQALLRTALRAPAPAERVAGDSVLAGLCEANSGGQVGLAGTITPVERGRVPASFGQELVRGLLNEDPTLSVPSARVMTHLLRDCPAVKERLLVQMVEPHPQAGGPERLLLPTLVGRVRSYFEAMGVGEDGSKALPHAIAAASVLAGWLRDCPSAVSALLAVPDAMHGIIAAVAHGTPQCDEVAMGLVAVLLGECMLFGGEGQDLTSASTARDAITTHVGLAKYFTRLAAVRTLPAFSTGAGPLSDTVTPPTAALDDHLRAFVAGFETAFQTCLMSGGGAGTAAVGPSPTQQQPPAFTTPPPPQAPPLPTPPTQTPPEDAAAFFEAAGGGAGVPVAPKAPPFTSTVPLPVTATGHVDVAALQRRCADLEAQAADAQAAADKVQRDLQDLSGAYATLEAHAAELEGRGGGGGAGEAAAAAPPPATTTDEATITFRIEAAVAAAQQEADDGLNDLLICLGQEERKVEALRAKLVEMGVDADGLIAAAAAGDD